MDKDAKLINSKQDLIIILGGENYPTDKLRSKSAEVSG